MDPQVAELTAIRNGVEHLNLQKQPSPAPATLASWVRSEPLFVPKEFRGLYQRISTCQHLLAIIWAFALKFMRGVVRKYVRALDVFVYLGLDDRRLRFVALIDLKRLSDE
jgi:hypothetical protein